MVNKIVAIIPARGGSKRIHNKNLYPIFDKPLIQYTIDQAKKSKLLTDFFVSSDDKKILDYAKLNDCKIINRPVSLSKDTSTSEEVLIHAVKFIKKFYFDFDAVMMLQCTSPIRNSDDIDNAIKSFAKNRFDSLMSVVKHKRFHWEIRNEKLVSINYDYRNRPRTQEFSNQFMETGSIYITNINNLIKTKNRLGQKIVPFIMDEITNFEIDDINDIDIVKWAIRKYNL